MLSSWKAQPSFLLSLASLSLLWALSFVSTTSCILCIPLSQHISPVPRKLQVHTETYVHVQHRPEPLSAACFTEHIWCNVELMKIIIWTLLVNHRSYFLLELLAEESGLHPHKLECKIILLENSHHILWLSKRLKQI